MNRIPFAAILLLTMLVFSGCKKELDDGGINFSFIASKAYQYTSFSVSVSYTPYGNPVTQASTPDVNKGIRITGLAPGNYHWDGRIDYTSPQQSGNYSFGGDIIIEKGKIMHITLED